jgi:hypothetical protein
MPTMDQLATAVAVNLTDQVLIDQSGNSVTATVAQVLDALPVGAGVTFNSGGTLSADTTVVAPVASPTFSGTPTAPTPAIGDNSSRVATTAFVQAATSALTSGNTITLTGDVTGSGSGTIATTLPAVVPPGVYEKVTVNAKGQVVAGATLAASDVTAALGYAPANPADISTSQLIAAGSTTLRTASTRAADRINVLDFGADPTGAADSAPGFLAAMSSVASGTWGRVWVPRGNYKLNSAVNQPSGRSISVLFDDGANIVGTGYLGVDRVESFAGPYRTMQNSGGYFGFAPNVGSTTNLAFDGEYLFNTPQNSLSMRVGWDRRYTNNNLYGKYHSGIDIAEQRISSWPNLYDNSSGWGHWEVVSSTTIDEASMAHAGLSTSAELSELDVVNNGPETGWTWKSEYGTPVQGMSIDPWGQNGNYGGHLLFAYGTVGSFDGSVGGLNQRWIAYPAAFSAGNPGTVAQNATLTITMDLGARATATLSGGGVGSVSVSLGGGAYTSAPAVSFAGGGGSGAAGTAVMLGGAVVGVAITNPGSGYTSAPTVTFGGGGVTTASPVTVALNPDGSHGDLTSIAASINAASITSVRAAVTTWGGVVSRLVIFGTNASDLGTLTLGGSASGILGLPNGPVSAVRGPYAAVLGGNGSVAVGDKLSINAITVTVGGSGTPTDVASAINSAHIPGVAADVNATGQIIVTAWMPAAPGGLVLANVSGYTTLAKLSLNVGTFLPPVPPKGFATAASDRTSPVCQPTDQLSITATDLAGNVHGPISVTLNGGDGSGWPAAVAASIRSALQAAGIYSSDFTSLSTGTAVVAVRSSGIGGDQGVSIRNTAGGSLTLANANGTPLETLGLVAGTYQPGGYSAASQSAFMAAKDAIAPRGRGVFVGGASSPTDVTTWPATPFEARGSFLHGLRLDKATLNDGNAIVVAPGQAIAWGTQAQGQTTLVGNNGTLLVNGVAVDAGSAGGGANIPAGSVGQLIGASGTAGVAGTVSVGSNLSLSAGTLSLSPTITGTISLAGTLSGGTLAGGALSGILANTGTLSGGSLAGTVTLAGTINGGTLTPATIAGGSLAGVITNTGTLTGGSLAGNIGLGGTLNGGTLMPASIAGAALVGTITNLGTISGGSFAGSIANTGTLAGGTFASVTLAGSVVLGGTINGGTLTPAAISGGSLIGTITNTGTLVGGNLGGNIGLTGTINGGTLTPATLSGGALAGTITNLGTISGGTFSGSIVNAGTLGGGILVGATLAGQVAFAADTSVAYSATMTLDLSTATRFVTVLGGNVTLANPLNRKPGYYRLKVVQDATGGRTIAFGSAFKASGGIAGIVLSTAANAVDYLYFDDDGSNIVVSIQKGVA